MLTRVVVAALAVFFSTCVLGATFEELKKFDRSKNDRIDKGRELTTYMRHLAHPDLAKYDTNFDGVLDANELAAMQRKFASLPLDDPKFLATAGYLTDEAERKNGIPLAEITDPPAPRTPGPCDSGQGLYVRADRLDISVYNRNLPKSAAKGASVSYTDDRVTEIRTAEIHGVASYVIARDPCAPRPPGVGIYDPFVSGYALATWLSADGKLSSDPSKEKSALKVGLDAQAEIFSGAIFDAQYVTFSPYYQTDFRGLANAYGGSATWQPYLLGWRLGGRYTQFSSWLDFFWTAKAEVDYLHVTTPGLTDLKPNTDYAWLGGMVRLTAFPLPDLFNYRLSLIGTYKQYWDARSQQEINLASAAVAYNITEDGSTSVSFEYQRGTEKATMKFLDQYLATLNYKF